MTITTKFEIGDRVREPRWPRETFCVEAIVISVQHPTYEARIAYDLEFESGQPGLARGSEEDLLPL
jgi:hypothetical protein